MIKKDFDRNTGVEKLHFDLNHTLFSDSHMKYLSKYANNILQFENPQSIDLPLNEKVFDQLFSRYISEIPDKKSHRVIGFKTSIRETLNPQIEENSTWYADIDGNRVKGHEERK